MLAVILTSILTLLWFSAPVLGPILVIIFFICIRMHFFQACFNEPKECCSCFAVAFATFLTYVSWLLSEGLIESL